MKHIKILIFLMSLVLIVTSSIAQDTNPNKVTGVKHSHLEYEKSLKEMKDSISKSQIKLRETQLSMQSIRDKVDNVSYLVDLFLKFYAILLTITFGGAVAYTIVSIRIIKTSYENRYKENYDNLAKSNLSTITKMIQDEEWRNKTKIDKKILVLNKKGTGMKTDFKKVIPAFLNHKLADITNLEDSLNIDYSGFDLVIIENCDDKGYWKLVAENKSDAEEIKEVEKVKNVFIALGNKICPKTALIYYGKQGRGNFPSESVDENKRHMISYANTPSTLFGNILDLLKFKAIIEDQQIY